MSITSSVREDSMRLRNAAAAAAVLGAWVSGAWLAGDVRGEQMPAPTYAKDVAPILFKNCTGCHRPGEIGPMSLLTYADVRPYASSIREEVEAGHMPPWHAEAPAGTFRNDRRLSDADRATLARWVDAGAPRGDDKDMPPRPTYTEGWTIGEPDAVFELPRTFDVPASGTIEYQYFEVPTNFTEDKWIQAVEIRPDARAVVHHILVYAREPEGSGPPRPRALVARRDQGTPEPPPPAPGSAPRQQRRLGSLIATMAPGWNATVFEPGTALQIRAGAVLTFQMHYTASGKAMTDRSSVGFVFADAPPSTEMRAGSFINGRFVIPAGDASHRVDAEVGFAEDVHVSGLFPHTHLRGIRWEYNLTYPDGRTEKILDVPAYDFNWQTYYMFAKPLAVPKGSKIVSSAWYDNSPKNPDNPDPKVDVRWGDQTWEEMQYTGIMYTVDGAPRPAAGVR
jgi:mono/diheme cytochrome c family protein